MKLLRGYAKSIRNAELGWIDRCRCYAAIVWYVFQIRKWWRIIGTTLHGTGIKRHQTADALSEGSTDLTKHQQQAAT